MSELDDQIAPINPDEIARLANALFRALPGKSDAGEWNAGPAAAPISPALGGIGLSPTALSPVVLTSPTFETLGPVASLADFQIELPGAGPPEGVSPIGARVPASAETQAPPPLSDASSEMDADGLLSSPPRQHSDGLYVFNEALEQKAARERASPSTEWTAARSDLLPGADYIQTLLKEPDAPLTRTTFDQDGVQTAYRGGHPAFDVEGVRRDFPILQEKIHGRPLIWLDNGATTQKPQAVIDRLAQFYAHENSNVHRAAHTLAARATDAYENARKTVARFIGAPSADNIVFVRGGTEAINLVAQSWGRKNVGAGDEIIVSHLEHHANIVPWQMLARETGARLRVIPVDDSGQILLAEYERLLSDKTKIVAVTHVSNALGTIVPIGAVIERGHAAGAKVLIDAAQSVAHKRIDVQALDADFLVFSGHKIFGPTGIGVLYGKRDVLESMPPWQGGGNMIADVTFEKTVFRESPARFEAGTGNLADAVGLGAALDYLDRIGMENIEAYEHDLLEYAITALKTVPGLTLFGAAPDRASVLSFILEGISAQDVGAALDRYGIAVRAGHHCAQPILRRFGLEETVRASLALYNTRDEIDCLVSALRQIAANPAARSRQ